MDLKLYTICWKRDPKYAMEILSIKLCHLQLLNLLIYILKGFENMHVKKVIHLLV